MSAQEAPCEDPACAGLGSAGFLDTAEGRLLLEPRLVRPHGGRLARQAAAIAAAAAARGGHDLLLLGDGLACCCLLPGPGAGPLRLGRALALSQAVFSASWHRWCREGAWGRWAVSAGSLGCSWGEGAWWRTGAARDAGELPCSSGADKAACKAWIGSGGATGREHCRPAGAGLAAGTGSVTLPVHVMLPLVVWPVLLLLLLWRPVHCPLSASDCAACSKLLPCTACAGKVSSALSGCSDSGDSLILAVHCIQAA